jgi:hypothetical protein
MKSDAVFAALQHVRGGFRLFPPLPTFPILAVLAPAGSLIGALRAGRGLPPFDDVLRKGRTRRKIDDGIDRARIIDLVVGKRGGIHGAGAGVREDLIFDGARRDAGP